MRIELLPGMTNVVRFPIERRARPTLDLLREIAPDVREVMSIVEGFAMQAPDWQLRDHVDAETADYIARAIAGTGTAMTGLLDELIEPVLVRAVAACRAAHDLSLETSAAQQALLAAQTAGTFWIEPLRERAEDLTERTAELLVEAHVRAEEAEGVARAVGFARRGEQWTPRDTNADMGSLIEAERVARAR
jgi:hypothetical protein